MGVADFKTCALAAQTAGPHRAEAALVSQFRKRVDLIHELRQLGAGEKFADRRYYRPSVDELRGCYGLYLAHAHTVFGVAFHSEQADPELALNQLADQLNAAVG